MSKIKLPHSSGNSMSITAPATNPASDLELKLPATIGTANQVLRNSSTPGTLEFGGPLAFFVKLDSTQAMADNTYVKIEWNNEDIDTDNAFDSSTNYRFTVPANKGGIYWFNSHIRIDNGNGAIRNAALRFYKNGSGFSPYVYSDEFESHNRYQVILDSSMLMNLNAGDYIEVYAHADTSAGSLSCNNAQSWFQGYKLGG